MYLENSISKLARSMEKSALAQNILAVLAKASTGQDLKAPDLAVIGDVVDFLNDAGAGKDWAVKDEVSSDLLNQADAFDLISLSIGGSASSDEVGKEIDDLIMVLDSIRAATPPYPGGLDKARRVFRNMLREEVEAFDQEIQRAQAI